MWLAAATTSMPDVKQVFLMTADLDAARTFYEDALGLTTREVGDSSVAYETGACELKVESDFDPEVLEQFGMTPPPSEGRGAGAVHVLAVEEPLDDCYARMADALDDAPGELLIEPREVPWGGRMFLARDPDGYVLEIRSATE